jgi:hypothetical protein
VLIYYLLGHQPQAAGFLSYAALAHLLSRA